MREALWMRRVRACWIGLFVAGCAGHDDLAGGAEVLDVSVLQGPSIPLVQGGEPVSARAAPVLAGRAGRIVVRFAYEADSEPRDVWVRVTETDDATGEQRALSAVARIAGGDAAAVEVPIDFDASFVMPGASFAVAIHESDQFMPTHATLLGVRVPAVGTLPLDAHAAPRYRAVLVPMSTASTGDPAISQGNVDAWKATLAALWPVADVELSIAEPLATARDLSLDAEWNGLLGDLAAHRAALGIEPDVFAFGVVAPQHMSGVGGIAASLEVENPYWRVAAGQLVPDAETMSNIVVHELGHALGRSHAPCGNPGGPDYAYPYAGAKIGVTGLDLRDGTLRDANNYFDFMSYCAPVFVSDYQFGALYDSLAWLATTTTRTEPAPPSVVIDPLPPARMVPR